LLAFNRLSRALSRLRRGAALLPLSLRPGSLVFVLLAAVLLVGGASGAPGSGGGKIVPVVGSGGRGDSGDGGPALKATFANIAKVAVDAKGNLYIPDTLADRVRKVAPDGIVTNFAGDTKIGIEGGDGGPALQAGVIEPENVAVDGKGNVYIVEITERVRKVSPDGIITTIAGGGSGLGPLGDGGPAVKAYFDAITAIATDRVGNVYIAALSRYGERVRKITPGGTITTVAGKQGNKVDTGDGGPATKAGLTSPAAMTIDARGNIYLGNLTRVRKVSPSGIITTVAGNGVAGISGDGGPATKAQLSYVQGLAVDKAGNLYIAAFFNHLRKVDATTGKISTVAKGVVKHPSGLAIDARGNLFVPFGERIWKVPASLLATPGTKEAPRTGTLATVSRKIETDLVQLAAGRAKLKTALAGAISCSISPTAAAAQVASVIANRQHVLAGLSRLATPTAQARRIVSLFKQALTASIAADRYYRAWLSEVKPSASGCSLPHDQNYQAAQRGDALATAAKQRFVAALNPLARQLHLRTWAAAGF
jgi:hypothetical protein